MRSGTLYPRTMSERPTSDNASGLWPTPAAQNPGWKNIPVVDKDGNPPTHFHQRFYHAETGRLVERGLEQAVQWPTPLAQEAKHGTVTDWELTTDHVGTKESLRVKVAKAEQPQWRTPHANNWKNASTMEERTSGGHTVNLQDQVRQWPTPSAREWTDTPGMAQSATNADGSHRDRTDQLPRKVYANEPQGTTQGGSLNPTWVEWLMGYPSEWTVLED